MSSLKNVSAGQQPYPVIEIEAQNESASPFTEIPFELILLVFSFFKADELIHAGYVCRRFKLIAQDENLWKRLLKKDFPQRQISGEIATKTHYSSCYRIKRNWKNGVYLLQTIKTEDRYPREVLLFDDGKIIGSDDKNSIKIWDTRDGTLLSTFEGHPGSDGIIRLVNDHDLLISYAAYGMGADIKIWDRHDGTLLGRVNCLYHFVIDGNRIITVNFYSLSPLKHKINVCNKYNGSILFSIEGDTTFIVDKDYLYSGHSSGTIRIWNKHDGSLIKELDTFQSEGQKIDSVKLLCIHENLLFSGYESGIIKVWDIQKGTCIRVLSDHMEGCRKAPERFHVDGDYLFSIHGGEIIKAWNIQEGSHLYSLEGHKSPILTHGNRLISAGKDGSIWISDKGDGSTIQKLDGHQNRPTSLNLIWGLLISSSSDGTKCWDIDNYTLLWSLEDDLMPQLYGERLICANRNGHINIYNFSPFGADN